MECLHHTKEVCCPYSYFVLFLSANIRSEQIERARTVKAHFIKKAEQEAKEGRKAGDILADGVIVGLGLINRKEGQ